MLCWQDETLTVRPPLDLARPLLNLNWDKVQPGPSPWLRALFSKRSTCRWNNKLWLKRHKNCKFLKSHLKIIWYNHQKVLHNSHGVSCNHSSSGRWDMGYIGLSHTTDKVEFFFWCFWIPWIPSLFRRMFALGEESTFKFQIFFSLNSFIQCYCVIWSRPQSIRPGLVKLACDLIFRILEVSASGCGCMCVIWGRLSSSNLAARCRLQVHLDRATAGNI